MNKLISVVAPMYNEETSVRAYCDEMFKMIRSVKEGYDFEIILVNDGSKDATYDLIIDQQRLHPDEISVVNLSRNFGLEGAVMAGLQKAAGDAVIVMDADLQDPPAIIPQLLEKWEQGADVVSALRSARPSDSLFKRISADFYYRILDALSGKTRLERNAANFRLLSRKALDQLLNLKENNGVFRVTVPYIGMKTDKVEYERDRRYAGSTKYNLRSMVPYALNSITGMSVSPLRLTAWLNLIPLLTFIVSLAGIIAAQSDWKYVWTVLLFVSLLVQSCLIALTVLAEYTAQIMTEVKGRPISIIYEYLPSKNAQERSR